MADGGQVIGDPNIEAIESALQQIVSFDVDNVSHHELGAAVLQAEQLLDAVHALSAELLERFEQTGG